MVLCGGKCKDNFVLTMLFVPVTVSVQCGKIFELGSALCKRLPVSTSAQEDTLTTMNLVKVAVVSVFGLSGKVLVAGIYRGGRSFLHVGQNQFQLAPGWARAEPTSDGGSIPVITDLRKGRVVAQKHLQQEKSENMQEKELCWHQGKGRRSRRFPCSLW